MKIASACHTVMTKIDICCGNTQLKERHNRKENDTNDTKVIHITRFEIQLFDLNQKTIAKKMWTLLDKKEEKNTETIVPSFRFRLISHNTLVSSC